MRRSSAARVAARVDVRGEVLDAAELERAMSVHLRAVEASGRDDSPVVNAHHDVVCRVRPVASAPRTVVSRRAATLACDVCRSSNWRRESRDIYCPTLRRIA
jgi:hypothetical protein